MRLDRIFPFISLFLSVFSLAACNLSPSTGSMERLAVQLPVTASPTIPPTTPLATLTGSPTLKPPPTFEPPTMTPYPSAIPSVTATPTVNLSVNIPGLNGAETPTPTSTQGCEKRDDWGLRYTVQAHDALARIAQTYNTSAAEIAAGNCLPNPDVITIGQELRVPGEAHPAQPAYDCVPFELLTPRNGTLAIEGEGTMTFNWRGPRVPYSLIRVHKPNGGTYEVVVELRQNETIDLYQDLPDAGTYTWYIYPLGSDFLQVCPEGGPWTFHKDQAPTATPTLVGGNGGLN